MLKSFFHVVKIKKQGLYKFTSLVVTDGLRADFKTKTRNNLKSLRVYFQLISRTLAPFFKRQTFRT